jgi:hypothetical protein
MEAGEGQDLSDCILIFFLVRVLFSEPAMFFKIH